MIEKTRRALSWRDVAIHLIVTLVAVFVAAGLDEALVALVLLASAVILFLRWTAPKTGAPAELHQDDRLAELEERIRFLEADQERMVELEERVDFTERLLARRREEERLPPS